ncbi:unnamed protein product [Cuscuta europaea]|uniref:RING-type domain-containing protein n=1 Tax=Cuscuta europaea TaxID=41803 RepID=A0A9P0Z749_CUSEU|nr:unnamed protein product [Cuscuta europaea]
MMESPISINPAQPSSCHGILRFKIIHKRAAPPPLASEGSSSTTTTFMYDENATAEFNPRHVLVSTENVIVFFSDVLSDRFGLDPNVDHLQRFIRRLAERVMSRDEARHVQIWGGTISVEYVMIHPHDDDNDDDDSVEEEDEDEDGPVGLSEDDIRKLKSETWEGGADAEKACAVCLSEYEEGEAIIRLVQTCSHSFHKDCIVAWLRQNGTCPICRSRAVYDVDESASVDAATRTSPGFDIMSLMPHNLCGRPPLN